VEEFEIDLADPAVRVDPYPHLAPLRGMGPVVRSRSFGPSSFGNQFPRTWVVHRYEDVRRVYADHGTFSSARLMGPAARGDGEGDGDTAARGRNALMTTLMKDPEARAMLEDPEVQANFRAGLFGGPTMLSTDRPEHDRLRGVVNKAFFPRQVSRLEGSLRELTQDLVRPFARSGEHDLLTGLADPLPSIVIAEMLGIPREDHERFNDWSNAVIGVVGGADEDQDTPEDPMARLRKVFLDPRRMALVAEFRRYLAEQIERYRHERADNLISRMVEANEDDLLTADELTASTFLLLIAGNETTTRLISNLTLALDRHPDQRELLVEDPSRIPAAVEEALRFDPPVQAMNRVAVTDTEVAGTAIPEGSVVTMYMAAANRDPRQFAEPDRFDVGRTDPAHVSFGYGIHFCLGAPLARRETRIAFEELLKVVPGFRVTTPDDQLNYSRSLAATLRGPQRLHIAA
jgi:cytochrome P450